MNEIIEKVIESGNRDIKNEANFAEMRKACLNISTHNE